MRGEKHRGAAPRRRSKIQIILLCIFLAVFCVSAYMVAKDLITARKEAKGFEVLAESVQKVRNGLAADGDDSDLLAVYAALHEQNPDFFGWLTIEGTVVDYPVMYTPENSEYYLHRDFEKNYSGSGVPFLDGAYREGYGNYLIYGHHMKNGSMFASLPEYADAEFWQEHRYLSFDTLDELGEYEVFAAFYARIYGEGEQGFRYYEYLDLSDPAVFAEYVAEAKAATGYDTGITPVYGEQLVTLSTCAYQTTNGRFVVVARRIG